MVALPAVIPMLDAFAAEPRQPAPAAEVLFRNVRVFDGRSDRLSGPTTVLVRGNTIASIGAEAIPTGPAAIIIEGGGRTLMPGLIDAHTHLMFETLSQVAILTSDIGFVNVAATKAANDMLLRGFTSVRDLGGPVFGLKRGIDAGLVPGPRIWPSGAFISQTGGHGDFSHSERVGAAAIADDADTVRLRAREQLALGVSQIKLMAGGGVSSNYDPLDVTQYTVAELRTAVEAAENWGTYVTVHAYTPAQVLKMATADNAELLALSGLRSPYAGTAGRRRDRCAGRPAAGRWRPAREHRSRRRPRQELRRDHEGRPDLQEFPALSSHCTLR